jgi:stage V sporulation protein R
VVSSTDRKKGRDELVASRVNADFPYIVVEDGVSELYLAHRYEGQELDISYLEKVLIHVINYGDAPSYGEHNRREDTIFL